MKLSSLSNKLHFATAESKVEDNGKKLINVSRKATIEPLGSLQVAVMLMRNHNHWVLAEVLLVLSLLLVAVACEPEAKITFENQRNQEVTIFYKTVRKDGTLGKEANQGIIPTHTTKTLYITFLGNERVNRIEAIDPSGKVVYSHDYNMDDLEKIAWKITIPP